MTGAERCYCGDTECPSCGTAQGTYEPKRVSPKGGTWITNTGTEFMETPYEPKPLREIRHLPDGWWITKDLSTAEIPYYYIYADAASCWEIQPRAFGAIVWQLAEVLMEVESGDGHTEGCEYRT